MKYSQKYGIINKEFSDFLKNTIIDAVLRFREKHKMRIAICDDEEVFRRELIGYLEKYFRINHIDLDYYEFRDGSELLNFKAEFDMIFMDYEMKNLNGIDTVSELRKRNVDTMVVFISSYREMVFDTFMVKAFRFLVKPLNEQKLNEAIDAYIEERNNSNYVIVRDLEKGSNISLPEKKIALAQAENVYTNVFTSSKVYRYNNTLSAFEGELSSNFFFRTHRSYLINLFFVDSFSKSEITLTTGERVLLSKTKYTAFKKQYFDFIKKESLCIL